MLEEKRSLSVFFKMQLTHFCNVYFHKPFHVKFTTKKLEGRHIEIKYT